MKPRRIAQSTSFTLSFTLAALLLGHSAHAADGIWTNTAGGTYSTIGNWSATVAGGTGATADFNTVEITAVTTVAMDSPLTLGSLIFGDITPTADPNTGANFVGGNTVTPTGGWVLNNGAAPANILTMEVAAGSPVITVNDLGSFYAAFAVTRKAATLSTVITGTQGLTKNGAGRLALSGANTFTGGLMIDAGIVTLSGAQGFTGGISATSSTSRLEFTDDTNIGANDITLTNGSTLARLGETGGGVGTGRTLTLGTGGATISYNSVGSVLAMNHTLAGAGLFTLSSAGQGINLTGSNSAHTGGFNISSGNLWFTVPAALPTTGQILIGTNGGLVGSGAMSTLQTWLDSDRIDIASTGSILLTGITNTQNVDLTGYPSLFLGGSNRVNLGAPNTITYSGIITPDGSTYRVTGGRGVTLALANTNALTGSRSVIAGISTVGSTVSVTATNDFTGGTTVSGSTTLVAAASGALGSGTISVTASASLRMTGGVTLGNALTLNGGPSDAAFGALHGFSGANIYGGNITVATGARIAASNTTGNSLTINGDIALGSNGLSFTTGANAAFAGGDITVAGAISGTAGITKNNATGTLTLSNANPGWSGNTTVAGGTLALANNTALGTAGTLTLSSSATVRSTDATDRTIARTFGTFAGTSAVYTFGATSGGTGNLAFTSTSTSPLSATSAARTFQIHNTTKFSMGFSGGSSSLNKTGNGTLIMNGTSTYTGGTTVTAGTLGGTGTIGATSVLAAGTIAPGDGGIGTFNTGAVTLAGTLAVEFNGAICDQLASTGAIDLTGATLTVASLGSYAGPYVIAQGTSVVGAMTVPPGYAVDISSGTQAILTQTGASPNFAGWASANGVTGGVNGDSDNDGIPNGVEYGLNLNFAGSDASPGTYSGNLLTFNKRAATSGNTDLSYRIEISSDLGVSIPWAEVGAYVQNDSSIISATIPNGPAKNFARLRVVVNP